MSERNQQITTLIRADFFQSFEEFRRGFVQAAWRKSGEFRRDFVQASRGNGMKILEKASVAPPPNVHCWRNLGQDSREFFHIRLPISAIREHKKGVISKMKIILYWTVIGTIKQITGVFELFESRMIYGKIRISPAFFWRKFRKKIWRISKAAARN